MRLPAEWITIPRARGRRSEYVPIDTLLLWHAIFKLRDNELRSEGSTTLTQATYLPALSVVIVAGVLPLERS